MNANHRDLISILFTATIVLLAGFIAHRFIIPLTWAGIIAIATWPVYKKFEAWCGQRQTLVASLLTLLFTFIIVIPLLWLMVIVIKEARYFINYLIAANIHGMPAPEWFHNIPKAGSYLTEVWQQTFAKPHGITEFLSAGHGSIKSISSVLKTIGNQLVHRSAVFGFAILCLFFFYRDGERLAKKIDVLGNYCLQERWSRYADQLPRAITATVNGLVLVGIAIGIIMGTVYAIAGIGFSTLLGAVTAVLAMIPFGAPLVYLSIGLVLFAQGHLAWAVSIVVIGAIVMFIADHFVRPVIIGSATRLHFLAVFFGVLGGIETLGLVGLFIGPVVMVLFTTLWSEAQTKNP